MALFAAFAFYGAISFGIMVADRQPPISYVSAIAICNLVQKLGWPIKLTSPPIYFEITAEDE